MEEEYTGACLCGAVRLRARGQLTEVVACHCSQCRRQTGLYYAATDIADEDLQIEGEENISWYRASSSAQRGFCRSCGSALFWKGDGARHISVMAGLFDRSAPLKLAYHIYCADKADFYEIEDDLPHYPQGRPSPSGSNPGLA
ncbi:GFA family protein [Rhizobium sp. BK251]|uniref:GFA family protein n=1 Tax=Rhizobium sp. BK251 TaxID=2512125 RepID=UPI00104ADE81|nr:GFA family protein [Rhizobium sp. BK251]TCL73489.1 hypothetical protein EV286_10317 [Rhizobium sp. BK251]